MGTNVNEVVYWLGKSWRWFRAQYHIRTGLWWWGIDRWYADLACEREATERRIAKEFRDLGKKWSDPDTWSESTTDEELRARDE